MKLSSAGILISIIVQNQVFFAMATKLMRVEFEVFGKVQGRHNLIKYNIIFKY